MITENDVLRWLESLSVAQGFYGRVLEAFREADEEVVTAFIDTLNENGVRDIVDFTIFIEEN